MDREAPQLMRARLIIFLLLFSASILSLILALRFSIGWLITPSILTIIFALLCIPFSYFSQGWDIRRNVAFLAGGIILVTFGAIWIYSFSDSPAIFSPLMISFFGPAIIVTSCLNILFIKNE